MMKLKLYVCFSMAVILLAACKKENTPDPDPGTDGEPTVAESQFNLLRDNSWMAGNITKDGSLLADEYPYYKDFTISFSGSLNADKSNISSGTYDTNDPGDVLPSSGWEFKEGDVENTLLMNGIEVAYEVSENSLRLEFTRSPSNARAEAVSGQYIFDLIPQP